MEPCINEYGVMGMDDQRGSLFGSPIHIGALYIFKEDVYGFGVILLESVTSKLVKVSEDDELGDATNSAAMGNDANSNSGTEDDIHSSTDFEFYLQGLERAKIIKRLESLTEAEKQVLLEEVEKENSH
ncbi:hypothetical protein JHK86_009667 [Glycine max]|nr:hypothetical protein JHK86_009667 [Glycine max]